MSHITYVIDLCTFFFSTFDMDKFGKIHQFCWKECLYISGGGHKHLQISTTLRSYIFAYLRRVTFKLANCTNFKMLFQVVSTDFPFHLLHKKLKKTAKRSILWLLVNWHIFIGALCIVQTHLLEKYSYSTFSLQNTMLGNVVHSLPYRSFY